jgi:formylmethanofuran dehydrogenase subunit E
MESDIQLLERKANLKSTRSKRIEEQKEIEQKEIEKLHHAAILGTALKRVVYEQQQNKKGRESFRCDNCGKSIRFSHVVRGNTYCTSCFVNNFLHVV